MTKQFRIVWADTRNTVMVIEAETARQAILRAVNGSGLCDHDVAAEEIGL